MTQPLLKTQQEPSLRATIYYGSSAGIKKINQDFHGSYTPSDHQLHTKGITVAITDGISSSSVSQIASESAIKSFINDYYCTPDTWSVKKSAQRVLHATNSWLYAQTQNSPFKYYEEKGYICTFSALIIKLNLAHLFHIGDSRIYRVHQDSLECMTQDHRSTGSDEHYLTRALGLKETLVIDHRVIPLAIGDLFILATDGLYDYINESKLINLVSTFSSDLDQAVNAAIKIAVANGSPDNLTLQIIRIEALPKHSIHLLHQKEEPLRPAPCLNTNTYSISLTC